MSTEARPWTLGLLLLLALAGCRQDMHDQPRYEPLEASDFFADGRSARPWVEGTIPRGHLQEDELMFTGRQDGQLSNTLPLPLTADLLHRGRERYAIFCAPCHGLTGSGRGMVVQRGFPAAASFHEPRLRQQPVGYYFDVITNGFGRMKSYKAQIPAADRWAITAFVRALQLSQNVDVDQLTSGQRQLLQQTASSAAAGATP